MVSSTHWLASASAMAVLERGGNAFDAAVAAGFVLQVVEPHLNGPGGEVPMVLYSAERERVMVVDGQGPAPAAASIARFRELGLELVPGSGLLPACVPGAFGGWLLLLAELGTIGLREALDAALGYAEGGYPVVPQIAATVARVEELFRHEWTGSAELWLAGGGVPRPGGRLRNPALAATWRRLLAEAAAASADRDRQIEAARVAFYEGFVADAIDRFAAWSEVTDATGRRHQGLLTGDDLARWRAGCEQPSVFDYRGVRVCKTGPWGQGPVFLQQLGLLAGFDLAAMEPGGADCVHTVVECAKLAFADREAWYGDPAFVDVPLAGLLDPAYAERRRALIGAEASMELRPGSVDGREPLLPPAVMEARWGEPAAAAEPTMAAEEPVARDTCHVAVADRHGNMIACTPSGGWLQSSPTIPELGFCLGTRGQMFWLAFGTPGGDQQDQWSLHWFLWHLHFGLDLQQAIDAPGFHNEHFPSSFYPRQARPGQVVVEERVEEATVAGLRARGHRVEVVDGWSLGRMCAVGRDPESGFLLAAANPRGRQGYAAGR